MFFRLLLVLHSLLCTSPCIIQLDLHVNEEQTVKCVRGLIQTSYCPRAKNAQRHASTLSQGKIKSCMYEEHMARFYRG